MFDPVNKANFPGTEEDILKFWEENKVFEKSMDQRKDGEEFVFYDGPPFATGLPHYGHLLAGTIKDVIPRYKTMRGKYVDRVFGWDCHGLPVEYEMEKELKLSGKKDIEDFGVDKFNEACRGIVLRYSKEWEKVVNRIGRWVDFERGYRTMDLNYMESIWWVFRQLWDQGLIYEGYKILPYCPRCSTPLSNFEANQGYLEVSDPAVTVRFQSVDEDNCYFLAWTTTPWTLPSNMALAVGPDIDYVKIADEGNFYILAEARVNEYYKDPDSYEIVERFKGSSLAEKKYIPLFHYFEEKKNEGAFKVVTADYVSTDDGTGIVHTAPGFGEDDAETGKKNGIPEVCPIDAECKFTSEVSDFAGVYVKDTDKAIIKKLKIEGKLVHRGTILHNYPHCWRDDTPLIYRAVSTWFVNIGKVKDKMLKANSETNWVPSHIKDGRFGKWLENARDWSISRNRYWGCPIPIWRDEETGDAVCIGSINELEELTGEKVTDIHKHLVDKMTITTNEGTVLERVPEVLDCWFESGAMPYAQNHYPFERKKEFEKNYPADFIAEGLDQTRGWFYTLIVLGAALFDKPAFKNVVVNGLILAEDGQKMSKRKQNYPDPRLVLDKYGADALRLFMLGSPVVRGDDLRFSEEGVKDVLKSVLIPIWNAYSFFITYARVDNWKPAACEATPPTSPTNPLDKWILSSLCEMVNEIRDHMDSYHLQKAANRFEVFVEDLTNWYIRRSRRRFWKSQNDSDKDQAYQTLHYVLITFAKTAAPFIPFVTDAIYRNLKTEVMPESVHLCDYPEVDEKYRDMPLEEQMKYTMAAVTLGRYLRIKSEIKVRQPLTKVVIVTHGEDMKRLLQETSSIIKEELNVKEVVFIDDENELVTRYAKANYKVLGPRLGKDMREAANLIAGLDSKIVEDLINGGNFPLTLSTGKKLVIKKDDLLIQRQEKEGLTVATEEGISVALDTTIDSALKKEGFAREFVSRIQNMRREMDLEVVDRIDIKYHVEGEMASALSAFEEYIKNETLTLNLLEVKPVFDDENIHDINGVKCFINAEKVSSE